MNNFTVPKQFEAIKGNNEKILWVGKPNKILYLLSGLPLLIFGLLWGTFDYFFIIRNGLSMGSGFSAGSGFSMGSSGMFQASPFMSIFFFLHLAPLWIGIFNMIRLILIHKSVFYAITTKRLMITSGIFGTDFRAIDYDRINDIEVNVNPIENNKNLGTIKYFTGKTNSKGRRIPERFRSIENPYEVFKLLKEISTDTKTDMNYPNDYRPKENSGYNTVNVKKY